MTASRLSSKQDIGSMPTIRGWPTLGNSACRPENVRLGFVPSNPGCITGIKNSISKYEIPGFEHLRIWHFYPRRRRNFFLSNSSSFSETTQSCIRVVKKLLKLKVFSYEPIREKKKSISTLPAQFFPKKYSQFLINIIAVWGIG